MIKLAQLLKESVIWQKSDIISFLNDIGQDKIKFLFGIQGGECYGDYGKLEFTTALTKLSLVFKTHEEARSAIIDFSRALSNPYSFYLSRNDDCTIIVTID